MDVEIRWFDGYKKGYTVPDQAPRIGPSILWMDLGPKKRFRFVHVPLMNVREVRSDEKL